MSVSDDPSSVGGTPRARVRPPGTQAPTHWLHDATPPAPVDTPFTPQAVRGQPDPVRYGDWEIKGIAIDF